MSRWLLLVGSGCVITLITLCEHYAEDFCLVHGIPQGMMGELSILEILRIHIAHGSLLPAYPR